MAPTTKTDYINLMLGYGRHELLKLLHRGGLKQGRANRFTDRELAELLWTHFGEPAALRRATR